MNVNEIIEEIKKALPIKYKETFTCSSGKTSDDNKCPHEATGWNSARSAIIRHFEMKREK